MKSTQAQAAAAIRKELKQHGIAASVRSASASMTTSVSVSLIDPMPATTERVRQFVAQFQYGHFDGMTDGYEYSNRRDELPQVRFATVSVEYSEELKQEGWTYCRAYFAAAEDLPADVTEGCNSQVPGMRCFGYELLYRVLGGQQGHFWRQRKPRATALALAA